MFIYKTTNLINGKIYIGKYQGKNPNYLGSGKYLLNAISFYGKENFNREIIEDNINDSKILGEREIYWIGFYKSTDKSIGYNILSGGNLSMSGQHHTEEAKRKIALASKINNIGHKLPKEAIENARKVHSGIPLTEEHKNKIKEALLGKPRPEEVKEKISQSHIGIRPNETTLGKMSLNAKLAWESGKHKRNLSDETKQKMAEARKLWWKNKSKPLKHKLLSPEGIIYAVINRKDFSKEHDLTLVGLSALDTERYSTYKGWTIIKEYFEEIKNVRIET
jgi:hypothetical protein